MFQGMRRNGPLMVLGILALAGVGLRAGAQNARQEIDQPQDQQGQKMMQCPMMETLKSVQLHADAPPVLLAQDQQLELTAQQKEQLRAIAAAAREQARDVLSEQQREKLAEAPSEPLSPMQLARMLGKGRMGQMRGGEGGEMCPMCMRMMQQRKEGRQDAEREQEARGEAAAGTP